MIKDSLNKNSQATPNSEEMVVLHRYFPSCFTNEGKFDIELFERQIKDSVDVTKEGYSLNFLGKDYARLIASLDTTTVISPDEEHNSKPENKDSENVYISGDNLDALHHLLKSYAGKIKCIYIDPPYNTGSDGFVYNDKFSFTKEELVTKLSISEEQAAKILDLTKRGSASHSAWLMFVAPRLQLAKDLLTDDGVIFISIDDNECSNLKILCDNVIFGEECFIGCIPRVTKKAGKSSEAVCQNHDYILVYSKTTTPVFYPLKHDDPGFKYQDEFFEQRGLYKLNQTLDYDSLQYSKSLDYPLEIDGVTYYPGPSKELWESRQAGNHDRADWAWRWSKEKFRFGYDNGFVVIKKNKNGGTRIYTKTYQKATIEEGDSGYYLDLEDRTKCLSTLEFVENEYSNDVATKDIAKTVGKKVFDHTKPISLIDTICQLSLGDGDFILDFFSGSATTAEAVMWHNSINLQKKIKYILVQLPETINEGTKAYNLGYRTIDDIGIARINLAAKLIKEEYPLNIIDYGFKHYTLKEVPQNTIDRMEIFNPNDLVCDEDIKTRFGVPTILTTWLIHDGYGFNAPVKEIKLNDYSVWCCGQHLYMINEGVSESDIVALIDLFNMNPAAIPSTIAVFGYSFDYHNLELVKKNLRSLKIGEDTRKLNIEVRY